MGEQNLLTSDHTCLFAFSSPPKPNKCDVRDKIKLKIKIGQNMARHWTKSWVLNKQQPNFPFLEIITLMQILSNN